MAIGGNRAQNLAIRAIGDVEIDAIEIVACLFGGDGKTGLVDEAAQVCGIDVESDGIVIAGHGLEVSGRKRRQREIRPARADGEPAVFRIEFQFDIGPGGQLAHNVEQRAGRRSDRAFAGNLRIGAVDSLDVEVGGHEGDFAALGFHQDVGQDRDRIAPLHHVLHMAERVQQVTTFNRQLHKSAYLIAVFVPHPFRPAKSGIHHRIGPPPEGRRAEYTS